MNGAALEEASGAGGWALKGFDYQVDVSTWLALDLMVGARLTPEMILEHVNEEDVEADIEDFEPTPVADTIPMRGYRQAQIVNMSRRGRGLAVGRAAAYALFDQHDRLSDQTVESISTKMVLRLPASIAGYLTATIGFRGTRETIEAISEALAASDDRRIFLSLLALAVRDRNPAEADLIASRLPDGHPARLWAEGSDAPIDRTTVIDLGDASAVKEAYSWMPQPEK